jgi:hypothetical protein
LDEQVKCASIQFVRRREMSNCLRGAAAASVAIWLVSVSAAYPQVPPGADATRGTASSWTPARTPDGQPDIQGIWEGGASFQDRSAVEVEVNVGPRDCNTYGKSAVNTPCAAYPALWTTAQRSGTIGKQGPGLRRGLIDPPDGKLPWSREGRAKYEDVIKNIYDPPTLAYLDPHARCMLPGVPRGGPGGIQILQTPGSIALFLEYDHVSRVIPLDGRPHVRPDIRLFMGDSVGRWEGTTLVVDTTNFTGRTWYDMVGTIQSDSLHVVERFTPVDANTIEYVVTIDDPKLFTKPWTFVGGLTRAQQEGMQTTELYEYACAEGLKALEQSMERPGKPLPPVTLLPRE